MENLGTFTITRVMEKMNSINVKINLEHQKPFPKVKMLSQYEYRCRWVEINPSGYFNRARFISSMIDFSFIKSLVQDCYSKEGAPCYDPCSMFLLDLFRWLECKTTKELCDILHDKDKGRAYRTYAGIREDRIPCEADFSNFRVRIGEERYIAIFQVLVEIVKRLGLLTGKILSHDGTLVPSFARYHGCNYACKECEFIQVRDTNFISDIRYRIQKLLEDPSSIQVGKEMRAYAKCPRKEYLPSGVNPCSIIVVAFTILSFNQELYSESDRLAAKLLDPEGRLLQQGLMLKILRSNISKIDATSWPYPVYVKCPKMPADLDARIGYRRSKYNPDKKEKVFGFQITISTSVEPELEIELPVACITGPGCDSDGNHFIPLKEQIKKYQNFETIIDIGDAGFDYVENYDYCRNNGSIPIFDYNPRGENLSQEALLERGYDQNGWPFAPCKCICKPNGYSKEEKRISFVCSKQCISSPDTVPNPIPDCPHLQNSLGYATHMSIVQYPRLICEVPRGSARYKKIRNLRVSSERTNSTAKADLDILDHPRVMGLERAKILGQIACIVTLLKRVLNFIVEITLIWRKHISTNDKKWRKELQLHKIPAFLDTLLNARAPPHPA